MYYIVERVTCIPIAVDIVHAANSKHINIPLSTERQRRTDHHAPPAHRLCRFPKSIASVLCTDFFFFRLRSIFFLSYTWVRCTHHAYTIYICTDSFSLYVRFSLFLFFSFFICCLCSSFSMWHRRRRSDGIGFFFPSMTKQENYFFLFSLLHDLSWRFTSIGCAKNWIVFLKMNLNYTKRNREARARRRRVFEFNPNSVKTFGDDKNDKNYDSLL